MFGVENINLDALDKEKLMECIKIYKEFKNSITNWPKTKLQRTNKFINKCVENQLERLNNYGLSIETFNKFDIGACECIEKPSQINRSVKMIFYFLNNSNQTFNNQSFFVTGTKFSKYYKKNKLIKSLKFKNRMYVIVTSVNDEEEALKKNISCPNCGNILAMSKLVSGCPYCHTTFKVSDLYPIVTNYYHSSMKEEIFPFLKYYLITNLIMFFPTLKLMPYLDRDKELYLSSNVLLRIYDVLICLTAVSLVTVAFLYFIRQGILFFKYYGGKFNKKSTYTKLENFMQEYDPNFTYYMFEGKIISMLKELIFSRNPNDLVICDYDNKVDFSNIVDANFFEMYIKNMYVKDDLIYIDLKMEMYNTLYIDNKIKPKKQIFSITVARKRNVHTISKFRIDNFNCPNCGAIIDIENDKCCAYCKSNYDFKDYDFVFKNVSIN